MRQHMMDSNTSGEYRYSVELDDIRKELDREKQTIGDGHGRDEEVGVCVAYANSIHDDDTEYVSDEAEYNQEEETYVPKIPWPMVR